MANKPLAQMLFAAALVMTSCGRDGLVVSAGRDASPDQAKGADGSRGVGDSPGSGGRGGIGFPFPDGGLGGLLGGILDAPRDNLVGLIVCGPEVRLGASCSSNVLGCVLPSLGGICLCTSGFYVCPLNTGPLQDCPRGPPLERRASHRFLHASVDLVSAAFASWVPMLASDSNVR